MEINKVLIAKFSNYCKEIGWVFNEYSSEFTFQFRLAWFLNTIYNNDYLVDFEVNVKKLEVLNTIKKEMDIVLTDKKTNQNSVIINFQFSIKTTMIIKSLLNKILLILGILILVFLFFRFCEFKKTDSSSLENNTNLIQQQLVNVGKLVVTEGHFSEVLTYKDQDKYLGGMISFDKKALIIVNADVTVAYDLHLMKYDIDEKNKVLTIVNIPKEEVKISPDIQFYDVNQSKLNPFTGDDYNKINKLAKESLSKKIEKSTLKTNAQNRLISELSKMLILTNSMGWKLQYQGNLIVKETDFKPKI